MAIIKMQPAGAVGHFQRRRQSEKTLRSTARCAQPPEFRDILIKVDGNFEPTSDVDEVEIRRNSRSIAWFNSTAVLDPDHQQGDANVLDNRRPGGALIPDKALASRRRRDFHPGSIETVRSAQRVDMRCGLPPRFW